MRHHLGTSSNPYDASMEMVMPGVQERFNGLASMMRDIESSIVAKVDASMHNHQTRALNNIAEIIPKEVSEMHVTAIQDLAHAVSRRHVSQQNVYGNTVGTSLRDLSSQRNETIQEQRQGQEQRQEPTSPLPMPTTQTPPRLSQHFASLSLMWDEWHGTGGPATKDLPIPGGFDQLENRYKSKWRRHFDGAQTRHFTRIRLIISGIQKSAEMATISVDSARDLLEPEWTKHNKSPDAMVKYLQGVGYIKKSQPRGKHANK